jgi:myo-inositol-1(or 4)-monophosphatase
VSSKERTAGSLPQLRDAVIGLLQAEAWPLLGEPARDIRFKQSADAPGFDIVTATDHAIQARLGPALERLLPGSLVLGEEGFVAWSNPAAQPTWLLDPLDGTINFAKGLPGYGLSLALSIEGTCVLGIVMDGVTGRIFDAVAGGGARLDGVPLRLAPGAAAVAPMCLSSGVFEMIARKDASALADMLAISPRIRLIGGQALQLCWVATGALALNVNREAKLWDDAAGALIVREAGGVYARLCGRDLWPFREDDPALQGASLFSLAGSAATVEKALKIMQRLAAA